MCNINQIRRNIAYRLLQMSLLHAKNTMSLNKTINDNLQAFGPEYRHTLEFQRLELGELIERLKSKILFSISELFYK